MNAKQQLLISDKPLILLPKLAVKIGLNEAVFLQQLHFWLGRSKNRIDGKMWVYKTFDEWQKEMPFISIRTLKRVASNLKKKKLIITKQKVHKQWYTINYETLKAIEFEDIKIDDLPF